MKTLLYYAELTALHDEELFRQYYQTLPEYRKKKIDKVDINSDIGGSLYSSLSELNATQKQAEQDIETFASGGDISIHDVMISSRKSSLAMQMAIQLRNQVINAYNELRNMTI